MPATTGGITTTRNNLFYVGAGKEATWGTAVAPTWFWRWLDGTDANPDLKVQEEREGDSSPHISLIYKTAQWEAFKVVEYLRPITVGYALQALLGTGSDTFTTAAQSTTLSTAVAAGATSFNSTASIGNSGTGYFNFSPAYAGATYEVVNVNLASRTGTGPYTYNLVAGQTFLNAHLINDPITSASTHVFTRQNTTYDAYALEYAFGASAFGVFKVLRVQDCICTDVKITSEAPNKPVKLEHTWYGAPGKIQAALSAPTFEGTSTVGVAGGPLTHAMGSSTWSIDGSTAGTTNAATVKHVDITLKNSTTPEELQSEGIYAPYYMPGNFDIDGTITVLFQNYAQYLETYWGSSSATTGATDSTLVGVGALAVTWANINLAGSQDGLNSLALSLPQIAYKAAKMTPKLDGKPVEQPISIKGFKSAALPTPITLTLLNSWNNQY